MIKKNNQTIGFIYKNNQNIDKIYKNNQLIFEQGFVREDSGNVPLSTTHQAIGKDLKDYKIYGNSIQGKLPSEYQQVEYIESTGTQYIDTGINPISSTRIDINFAYVGIDTYDGWIPIFGARSIIDNVQEQYAVFINNRTLKLATNYSSIYMIDDSNVYIETNKKYNLKNNQGLFYINDILESSISVSNTLSNNTRYPVYLFDICNYGSKMNRGTKMKLYSCKLYDGDTLIRNYIPCYRKSDNVIGLYDLVTNTFFTNAGTGVFLKGSNAPTPSAPIEIESVGDLVTDTNDINYGKYKIPVKVGNTTTNIYLDEPLRKVGDYSDYIDFKNQKKFRNVIVNDDTGTQTIENSYTGTTDSSGTLISLPNIPTMKGTTIFKVDTEIQPNSMYIKYKGK